MKILVINNNTQHLPKLQKALVGHQIEIQKYRPGLDFRCQGKDLVILSGGGGEGFELVDTDQRGKLWYEDEMKFIQANKLPVIGICMGFEVISAAYGAKVRQLPALVKGFRTSLPTAKGQQHLAKDRLKQFEYHRYAIPEVSTRHFEVLAHSNTGVEMIRHRQRPMIATQFHPEIEGGTLGLKQLIGHLNIA